MTLNTPRFALTYPQDTDAPDGPAQIHDIALDIETRLGYAGAQGGKSVVAATQNITATSYALAGTPDRVSGLVVPNDGDLIIMRFSALAKRPAASTLAAAVFLKTGGVDTQLKVNVVAGAPAVTPDALLAAPDAANYRWIYSSEPDGGLKAADDAVGNATDASEVTTGMILRAQSGSSGGGWLIIERLAAATYDVSVQWKVGSGTGVIKSRRLHAYTKEWPTSGV